MNGIDFFSSNRYIYLPTKNNPKVALCIDNSKLVNNAFKLYNPFSSKAKFLKKITKFSFTVLNALTKLFCIKKEKSDFIIYLEKLLSKPIITSVYFATAYDKVVLQLQSGDAKILGYIKYPLNNIGEKHINNEIKAIEILSTIGLVDNSILISSYAGKQFVLLQELNGKIGMVEKSNLDNILQLLEKDSSYKLYNHPRILELKKLVLKNDLERYMLPLESICNSSIKNYKVTYEHGDFTPWNIVKVKNKYIPFDFEYFVEDGLEYFDMLKYYYQVGKLLERKTGEDLYYYIKEYILTKELKELFILFLIKEIVRQKEEDESFEFEENMMNIMEKI